MSPGFWSKTTGGLNKEPRFEDRYSEGCDSDFMVDVAYKQPAFPDTSRSPKWPTPWWQSMAWIPNWAWCPMARTIPASSSTSPTVPRLRWWGVLEWLTNRAHEVQILRWTARFSKTCWYIARICQNPGWVHTQTWLNLARDLRFAMVCHGIGGLPQPGELKSVVPRCTKLGDDFTVALALSENGRPGYPQKQWFTLIHHQFPYETMLFWWAMFG